MNECYSTSTDTAVIKRFYSVADLEISQKHLSFPILAMIINNIFSTSTFSYPL